MDGTRHASCVGQCRPRSDGPGFARRPPSEHADALRSRNASAAIPRGDFPACDPWRGENPRRISAPGGCRPDHPLVAAGAQGYERRTRSRRAESAGVGRSQVRCCARGSCDSANHPTGLARLGRLSRALGVDDSNYLTGFSSRKPRGGSVRVNDAGWPCDGMLSDATLPPLPMLLPP